MPFRLTIEGFGEKIVDRELMRFGERLEQPTEALEVVATLLREAVEQQFVTEGQHASGGWPALALSTVERKARLGQDPHILRATGFLMESLTRKYDPGHIERLIGSSLVFGSTATYGVYHQSSAPRHKIPYRPPIALTQGDKEQMVKELQAALLATPGDRLLKGRV